MSASVRSLLAVAAAVAVAASAPAAAGAKPTLKPARAAQGVCAFKSGSLRPSPVRVCRKAVKAPRALPR